jgi:thiamine-phosphate pyrophosphorylase
MRQPAVPGPAPVLRTGLYPIVDVGTLERRGIGILDFALRVIEKRPPLLQLRAKQTDARETLALLRALRGPTRAAGVALFANDRPDLALLAECDGVHVGQTDLGIEDVRRVAPGLAVGVSTHDADQLALALAARPDYVAFGPVFATRSKAVPDPVVGLDGLSRAAESARRAGVALVAIGGIDADTVRQVGSLGAMAAVIGALLPASTDLDEVSARYLALMEALDA